MKGIISSLGLIALIAANAAQAHDTSGASSGFISGFLHPLGGWDHICAMVAVGLWGAILRAPAIWVLPVTFPLIMTLGGIAGVAGIALPGVEIGIAASAVVLGGAVLLAKRPPLWLAMLVVAVFAVFHGHAHGTELPHAANPLPYSLGFVIATGLLHLGGIAFGGLYRWQWGQGLVRAGGALIVAAGLLFLSQAL